ncbi:MAG: hypothetical protein ACXQS1_05805 [Methermicoccaceae archaeon]
MTLDWAKWLDVCLVTDRCLEVVFTIYKQVLTAEVRYATLHIVARHVDEETVKSIERSIREELQTDALSDIRTLIEKSQELEKLLTEVISDDSD